MKGTVVLLIRTDHDKTSCYILNVINNKCCVTFQAGSWIIFHLQGKHSTRAWLAKFSRQRRNEGLPEMQRANQFSSLLFKLFILNAPFNNNNEPHRFARCISGRPSFLLCLARIAVETEKHQYLLQRLFDQTILNERYGCL